MRWVEKTEETLAVAEESELVRRVVRGTYDRGRGG